MITAMVDLRFGEVAAALSVRLAGGVDERVAIGEDRSPPRSPMTVEARNAQNAPSMVLGRAGAASGHSRRK
jgi:hypothetical protein